MFEDTDNKNKISYKAHVLGIVAVFFIFSAALAQQTLYGIYDFSGGMNTWVDPIKMKQNQFLLIKNYDPNITAGSLSSRMGPRRRSDPRELIIAEKSAYVDIDGKLFDRLFVYNSRSVRTLFTIKHHAGENTRRLLPYTSWQYSDILANVYNPNRSINWWVYMALDSLNNKESPQSEFYNNVLRIYAKTSVHWNNGTYPTSQVIWYTDDIFQHYRILGADSGYFAGSDKPIKRNTNADTVYANAWIGSANISPLLFSKRANGNNDVEPMTVTRADSGTNIGRSTHYAFSYIYDGYQHSTMVEDSTGRYYVASANSDSASRYVEVSFRIPYYRLFADRYAYKSYFSTAADPIHSTARLNDSLGVYDFRVTGFAIYRASSPDVDEIEEIDKDDLTNYRFLRSFSVFDTSWATQSIASNNCYTFTFQDSSEFSDLTETYYDIIGHYSHYDMAGYTYSAILNGRRFIADVIKPALNSDSLFKSNDRVYYNPLQTYTDPPSYAHDSFPDGHYFAIPEANAHIKGLFAYLNRLFVSTETRLWMVTPGVDAHDFSIQEVPGSLPVNNQRTIQITPDGVFYKTINNAVMFNGNSSVLIGDAMKNRSNSWTMSSSLDSTFTAWYDIMNKEYWLFDSYTQYVYSVMPTSWRQNTIGLSDDTTFSALATVDVAQFRADSMLLLAERDSFAVVFQYPSIDSLGVVDNDTTVTVLKQLTTSRIMMGSPMLEKSFDGYSIRAQLGTPMYAVSDSSIIVNVYIDNSIVQRDTFRFSGEYTKGKGIYRKRGRDIKFDIRSVNEHLIFKSLEFLWQPLNIVN